MTSEQFNLDTETYLLFPIFGLGAAATLGIVSTDFLTELGLGIDLGSVVLETGGIEWTIGRVMSLVALAAVIINREEPFDFDGWGVIELWVLYATVGMIIAPPFFPALEETIASTPASFVAFTVQSIGFGLISWIN